MIRCAFIASYYGPYYSNYVASMLALEIAFKAKEYYSIYILPVEVQNFEWIKMLYELTDKVFFIKYKPYSIENIYAIRKILKDNSINLIYSRMCGWDFTAHFACPTLPIVWHMDMRVDNKNTKRRIKNWLKFRILAFGKTYHVAVSDPVNNAINSFNPKNKSVAIINAIDFTRLNTKNHSTRMHTVKILLFGWAPYIKGLDTALAACEKLNENGIKYELLVSAQQKTYDYINEYYSQVPEWLKLLPPTNEISILYDNVDMMLSASRTESFSYCLAEAIYSGLKVIYSDIDGTSWAGEFKNAVRFKTADVDDLQRAIIECDNMNPTDESILFNANLMVEKYGMDSWVNQMIDNIERIVK